MSYLLTPVRSRLDTENCNDIDAEKWASKTSKTALTCRTSWLDGVETDCFPLCHAGGFVAELYLLKGRLETALTRLVSKAKYSTLHGRRNEAFASRLQYLSPAVHQINGLALFSDIEVTSCSPHKQLSLFLGNVKLQSMRCKMMLSSRTVRVYDSGSGRS